MGLVLFSAMGIVRDYRFQVPNAISQAASESKIVSEASFHGPLDMDFLGAGRPVRWMIRVSHTLAIAARRNVLARLAAGGAAGAGGGRRHGGMASRSTRRIAKLVERLAPIALQRLCAGARTGREGKL